MTKVSLSRRLRERVRRTNLVIQALVLSASAATPILLSTGTAEAGQLTERFIDMSGNLTAEGSGRDGGDAFGQDVTYTVSFMPATTGVVEGIVIDFCSNSPIIGQACTAPTGFNINEGTLALANQTTISGFTIDASSTNNTLVLVNASGGSLTAGVAVSIDLGTAAAANGITNPTTAGTFYARILTYDDSTEADGYLPAAPDTDGAHIDDGGVALAVANELSISARVQEQLQFCVGTTDSGAASDCTDISGTAIDLGVVDSGAVSATAVDAGKVMIRTNAFNGATISYKAEQNSSSGKLKVAGAACSGTSVVDQCFNSTGTTQNSIVAGTEEFGMSITESHDDNGGQTQNLTCDAEYDGDGTCSGAAATGYAWEDTGIFDTIATSTSVIDDEMLELQFAASAAATTPTGLYGVTANFVATATF